MKVFVVQYDGLYEPTPIERIFASREDADQYAALKGGDYTVEAWDVEPAGTPSRVWSRWRVTTRYLPARRPTLYKSDRIPLGHYITEPTNERVLVGNEPDPAPQPPHVYDTGDFVGPEDGLISVTADSEREAKAVAHTRYLLRVNEGER